ncbi:hypothetical protein SAMN02745221_00555 [Thermosyntropha lipolytica DSM 11003]|uniref:Uncharacterized protein n=1 Tax=Thermosyntropha lipolytica DSM 11003 TaxID=1123382 RepID=A0A1M5L1L2_9FIRM|nr:hypothetical protein [Thermosyntropha lipolytica]SHG58938.1 hypothetical protein SAMN02745221_00555 [Thermosyntropha lipolytica DSM 11003]
MYKNLIVIILMAVILALLIPLTADIFSIEKAFTPDNLVRMDIVAR